MEGKEGEDKVLNELQTNKFDYSLLDTETADFLKDRENSMKQTLEKTAQSLGEDLSKARDKLSNHYKGTFEKWYTALGFKKQSVYNYINRYEYVVQRLDNQSDIEKFQELPVRLQNEMSKKTAKNEVNQAVFDGDITTHKEYKEMEKRLEKAEQAKQQAEKQAEQAKKSEEIALKKLEEEQSKEPEKIEVVPDDYDFYKGNYNSAISLQKRYKEQMEEMRKELNSVNETGDELEKERRKKETLQLKADNDVLSLANNIDDFLKENAVTSYREGAIASSDKTTKETLKECISALKSFTSEIERSLHGRIKI